MSGEQRLPGEPLHGFRKNIMGPTVNVPQLLWLTVRLTVVEPVHVCAYNCNKRAVHPSGGHLKAHAVYCPCQSVLCPRQGWYPIQIGGLPFVPCLSQSLAAVGH